LDFLGFSRPKLAFSMGYGRISQKLLFARLMRREAA
jgi:hypothetical protein